MGITSASKVQVSIYQFMNYSNTTTYKTVLGRSNVQDFRVASIVGLWRSTSAINTISLRSDNASYNFTVGSTFTLWGIKAA
jgi:FlaG/FlaF family flagellin (archaellin)